MRHNYLKLSTSVLFTLVLYVSVSLKVQAQETETSQDTTSTTRTAVDSSGVSLPDPGDLASQYEYDSVLDRYIFTESIGDIQLSQPLILTPEEFEELVLAEDRSEYFKRKGDALSGRKENSEEIQRDLLPGFYVDNNLFESIFGGSEIEIVPQGSVEMDLGLLFTRQDNPAFSPRNRRNLTFDFDQRISLSLQGQVGERLGIVANYDTESTFDFQNQLKIDYTPNEDDIIRTMEVGNVNMPINNALMQGAQSLFGFKTELQFGKTRVTGVFSEQKSERRTVNVEGGSTVEEFEKFALEYDQDRHFFLAHYFRDHYNEALQDYPFINSNFQIQRVQVWVTNRTNNVQNIQDSRNIVAIQDIGEADVENIGLNNPPPGFVNQPAGAVPSNQNNDFNPLGITGTQESVLNRSIREMSTVQNGFGGVQVSEGQDYITLENARQLNPNEYTLNTQLGYISLNQRLSNDEVLGVAFQYTINGEVYQVGEFANDGVNATDSRPDNTDGENSNPEENSRANQNLVVKMLKSTIVNVEQPVWDLMMKNIYSLGGYELERDDFRMNILYTDPQPLNYIKPAGEGATPLPGDVSETPLLRVFNLDKLNNNNDPINGGDGFFDYVPGITIDPINGNLIFTTVEPFGEHLFKKLNTGGNHDYEDRETWNANQQKYVFKSMYETTKIQAEQEEAEKNKFQMKGRYKSAEVEGIPIGYNLPPGSVTVTAGGRILQEGVDYVVNYELGRVQILNDALLASDTPIRVNTENNALFGQQTKRFTGVNVEHLFNENFLMGATFLNLKERPLTQKANYNYEPLNNSIFGFNLNYSTEVPFFTRMVNKLPNIDTDVESNFSVTGEFAYLQPGAPNINDFEGRTTTYVDDFESAQTSIDINTPLGWELSSAPVGFGGERANGDLSSGYKRAKMAWYTIDPIFYSRNRPDGITDSDLSSYSSRRVSLNEIFPNTDVVQGQPQVVYTMDVAYYPDERGPYNFNPAAEGGNSLPNPSENFGGMMRGINATNFEQSNVEFIEFWVMDPYIYAENSGQSGGTINFNLGNISEDVVKDGRKQYENGLPREGGNRNTVSTNFGKVPSDQSLVYAFDTEGQERENQDVGYNGLSDEQERTAFPDFANLDDPAADNYEYFLAREGSIQERYRNYNGVEGNSPTNVGNTDRGNTTLPTAEDVNRDNTMNTIDSYFEYEVPFFPGMDPENNQYITDEKELNVTLRNGNEMPVRWLQFQVPIYEPTDTQGGIADFRAIRFMRMFMSGFEDPTLFRFGSMEMVRGDYRRYNQSLNDENVMPGNSNTVFEVSAVNIEENENREPIPYVLPPGVVREELFENNTNIRQNEQSLALRTCDLAPQDARAVYKNFQLDMRQYKNLEMFLHAESIQGQTPLKDNQLVAFIRIGTDFTDNFYQIEVPLSPTMFGAQSAEEIWPEVNRLEIPLEVLQRVKTSVLGDPGLSAVELNFFTENLEPVQAEDIYNTNETRVGIKGNPSFGNVRVLMLGVKNGLNKSSVQDLCGEVWFNELRLTDLNNEGGWASIINMDTNLADFADFAATGRRSTVGFGSLNQGPNQRSREDVQQYDFVTNINMGQILPQKWGINIPVNYSRGEELITPKYDQEFLDVELEARVRDIVDPVERERVKKQSQAYTRRQSINVIGLRKDRTGDEVPKPYDIENFNFSAAYNQVDHRDFEIENGFDQNVRLGGTYEYGFGNDEIEPFKNISVLDSSDYFSIFKDFNFNPLPTNITASSEIFRQYNEQKFRSLELSDEDIGIPTLYQRNYLFDWEYAINYNLTRALSFNFSASNNRMIRNYLDEDGQANNSIGLWDDFFNVGEPNLHYQSLQLNYDLPLEKIPALNFVKATYSYTGDFQWQRGSRIYQNLEGIPDIGHSIQNSSAHQINANLDLQNLYNYVGLVEKSGSGGQSIKERSAGVPTLDASTDPDAKEEPTQTRNNKTSKGFNTLVSLTTFVKRIQVNYRHNEGSFMPGYLPRIGFMGTLKPSTGFVFGLQEDIRYMAARRGWLTLFQNFNQQYSRVKNEQLDVQASLDILPDLTIDVSANRNYAETFKENYRVNPNSLEYQPLTPFAYGNFNTSTILLRTAFNQSSEERSETFESFRRNRLTIARRLAARQGLDIGNTDDEGYPVGYGKTSQAVLLPAFISAYTGRDAETVPLGAFRDVPLPNWDLKYTGLMRLGWFKDKFRRFSINHGYQSNHTINQFQTNLDYDPENPFETNQAGDFKIPQLYSNIVLTELFTPLIRVDFETKTAIQLLTEIRKDRALSLNFDNNLLTETSGNEYRIGTGYRIKDLKIATSLAGRNRILSSDLNLKADISFRRNKTIIRYLDLETSQVVAGQDIWAINFTADYAISRNLTAIFYYDHNFSEYAVSTAYPQTTIRSGVTLRYNFGN